MNKSLHQLIETLRTCELDCLELSDEELTMITCFDGICDFAGAFVDLMAAAQGNSFIRTLKFTTSAGCILRHFPIINTLCRYLPNAEVFFLVHSAAERTLELLTHQNPDSFAPEDMMMLLQGTKRFKLIELDLSRNCHFHNFNVLREHERLECFILHDGETCFVPSSPLLEALGSVSTLQKMAYIGDIEWNRNAYELVTDRLVGDPKELFDFIRLPGLVDLALCLISLSDCEFPELFGDALASSRIERLHLEMTEHREQVNASVSHALASMTTLRRLTLGANNRGEARPSIAIGDIVSSNRALRHITLRGFAFGSEFSGSLVTALAADRRHLEHLELKGRGVTDSDLCNLLQNFAENDDVSLESLEVVIDRCEMDSIEKCLDSVEAMAKKRLKHILIRGLEKNDWDYSHERGRRLVNRLCHGYNLESADLRFLDLANRVILESYTRLNRGGRRYLSTTRSRRDGVEVLVHVREYLNDCFIHLLENPSLCVNTG